MSRAVGVRADVQARGPTGVSARGLRYCAAARGAIGAVVARFVHTEEVTGSNPVSPTLYPLPAGSAGNPRRLSPVTPSMTTIGLIGAGHIGGTLAKLAVAAGHDVVLSNSRGPHTLTDLVDELGDGARAGTVEEAAAAGDVVVVTDPAEELPRRSRSSRWPARS